MKRQPASNPLLLAYYADDFTGSTDALESLACAGLRTVLFLQPPTPDQLALFPGLRAFGISGGSRIMSPAEMESELPPAFEALKRSGAPIIHYKTCSTFDSSPATGSIGRAIELGRRVFGNCLTPLVVGFPAFGRYVVFGNLFARSGNSEPLRLDRHPMRRHPVTPMEEADLRLHLARQTNLPIELVDVLKLRGWGGVKVLGTGEGRHSGATSRYKDLQRLFTEAASRQPPPIVLFDTLSDEDLPVIGRLISGQVRLSEQLFCAGSSGIGYALAAHWRQTGLLPLLQSAESHLGQKCLVREPRQTVVISGSCSPNTDRQIGQALEAGFAEVACDSGRLADVDSAPAAIKEALACAQPALQAGRHVIFHTARGVADSRRVTFEQVAQKCVGANKEQKNASAGAKLGQSLGQILLLALERTGARRAVICGGDTATQAGRALNIMALEYLSPFATGAPLCRIHARGSALDGCELVCKGGQMGSDTFLLDLVNFGPTEAPASVGRAKADTPVAVLTAAKLCYEFDESQTE